MSQSPYDPWAEIYDSVYSYIRSDLPLYTQAAIESGGPVLELGVGTGRVAIPTSQLGIDVVGVDSSEAMLAVAARKAAMLGDSAGTLELVQADMRDFTLRDPSGSQRKFSLVTIPFRGFLALLTVEDQFSALRRIHRHLQPGGRLIFNIFVPDPNMALEQSDVPRHLTDVTDPETGVKYILYQQSQYDAYNQIVSVRTLIEELDRHDVVSRRLYRDYQLRYCHRWEVHHMLQLCGFEIEALFGDFDLSDFDESSTEMIWVARRP
jgi:SAM-dependent methyltransferase